MPDTFRKVLKDKPFSAFDNDLLRDPRLSLKARGMLVTCMSLPPDWNFSIRGLLHYCKDGRDAVASALNELEAAGYLRRNKLQAHKENGTFGGTEYVFYEDPQPERAQPCTGFPSTVEPSTAEPSTENPSLQKKEEQKKEQESPPKAPRRGRRAPKSIPEWEPDMFERFWTAYPRGEDRMKAVAEWDALKPDRALMRRMGEALRRQMESDEWQRGIGIPYACRWLRNRRWEDPAPAPLPAAAPEWQQEVTALW